MRRPLRTAPSRGDVKRQIDFLRAGVTGEAFELTSPRRSARRGQAVRTEAAVQRDALLFLAAHSRVARVQRQNNGAAQTPGGQFVRFVSDARNRGIPGLPDISGMTTGGRHFDVECKASASGWRSKEWFREHWGADEVELTEEQARIVAQARYLAETRRNGGLSCVVWGSKSEVCAKLARMFEEGTTP